MPWDAERLIEDSKENKIVVTGNELKEQGELLKKISNYNLIPFKEGSYMDATMYYVFESKNYGKLFDVTISGGYREDGSIFVNELEVKSDILFYEIVTPFLPDDVAKSRGLK